MKPEAKTVSVLVRIGEQEKADLQKIANAHTDGNISDLMRKGAHAYPLLYSDKGHL